MKTTIDTLQAVEIEINHQCNRSCSYCPNSILERKTKGQMSLALYEKILDNLVEINFAGRISYDLYNEPLLHPDLEVFARQTKLRLPKTNIQLYSNGTLLTAKKLRDLLMAGVDRFIITRHEADYSANSSYVFEKTFAELSDEERVRVEYKSFNDLSLVNRGGLLKHIAAEGLPLYPCFLPTHMFSITVDGRVLGCFEDYEEHLIFGDIKKQRIIDIWNDEKYILFRNNVRKGFRHLYKPCQGCSRRQVLPPF